MFRRCKASEVPHPHLYDTQSAWRPVFRQAEWNKRWGIWDLTLKHKRDEAGGKKNRLTTYNNYLLFQLFNCSTNKKKNLTSVLSSQTHQCHRTLVLDSLFWPRQYIDWAHFLIYKFFIGENITSAKIWSIFLI